MHIYTLATYRNKVILEQRLHLAGVPPFPIHWKPQRGAGGKGTSCDGGGGLGGQWNRMRHGFIASIYPYYGILLGMMFIEYNLQNKIIVIIYRQLYCLCCIWFIYLSCFYLHSSLKQNRQFVSQYNRTWVMSVTREVEICWCIPASRTHPSLFVFMDVPLVVRGHLWYTYWNLSGFCLE